jgi:hypothetical protein
VSIVAAGRVGSTLAYSLVVERSAGEIVLVDVDHPRAEGVAKDIAHAVPFGVPTVVTSGGYDACRDSDIVAITSGVAQKPGESRLDLVGKNIDIYREIVPQLERVAPNAVVVVVSDFECYVILIDLVVVLAPRVGPLPYRLAEAGGMTTTRSARRSPLARGARPRRVGSSSSEPVARNVLCRRGAMGRSRQMGLRQRLVAGGDGGHATTRTKLSTDARRRSVLLSPR